MRLTSLNRSRTGGFSFVEMSAVLFVIMLVVATVMPSVLKVQHSQRSLAFRIGLTGLAQTAKRTAMEQNRTIEIVAGTDSFSWRAADSEASGSDEGAERESTASGGQIDVADGTEIEAYEHDRSEVTADEWVIGFYPDGTSDSAKLQFSQEGRQFVLVVDGHSGTAKLAEGTIADQEEETWPAGEIEKRAG